MSELSDLHTLMTHNNKITKLKVRRIVAIILPTKVVSRIVVIAPYLAIKYVGVQVVAIGVPPSKPT